MEELRQELKNEVISRERALAALNEKHEEAINAMANRLESEVEDKSTIAEAARKEVEKFSRTLSRRRRRSTSKSLRSFERHDSKTERYRRRLSTLAKAMEDLQVELREETNKNSALTQELNVLKDLAEVGSTEAQERFSMCGTRSRQRASLRDSCRILKSSCVNEPSKSSSVISLWPL